MKTVLAALTLLSAAVIPPLLGQGDVEQLMRRTLAGWEGVNVLIERISDEAERDGLREEQIRTDIELKLRQAGIKVLVKPDLDLPYLYVEVAAFKNPVGLYATYVSLSVQQMVALSSETVCKDCCHDLVDATFVRHSGGRTPPFREG